MPRARSPSNGKRPRAYYASVSYADNLIGKLVDAVDLSPSKAVRENTLIVVWGDNGMHLGPVLYGKKTVYEQATRTPLLIVPSLAWIRAQQTQQTPLPGLGSAIAFPVETIDIYPTIIDLANVPIPTFPLTGTSLVPYFKNPNKKLKNAAVSQYRDQRNNFQQTQMGYSIRTENYRLIKYFMWDQNCFGSTRNCGFLDISANLVKAELYFYSSPGAPEVQNVYNVLAHRNARIYMENLMRQKSPSWAGLLTDSEMGAKLNSTIFDT
jgi:arylsulfatase A-like enzyme